jgi:3-deoxy-7-phosphoheptulonate synthase
MVEAHPDPRKALSDGPQSLDLAELRVLMAQLEPVANAVGRSLGS